MTSAITHSDRALIDAAIAAGRVQRIPQGVYGIDIATGRPWHSIEAAIEAHREWMARLTTIKRQPEQSSKRPSSKSRQMELDRAYDDIRLMAAKGVPYSTIGLKFGLSGTAIQRWCKSKGFHARGKGWFLSQRSKLVGGSITSQKVSREQRN